MTSSIYLFIIKKQSHTKSTNRDETKVPHLLANSPFAFGVVISLTIEILVKQAFKLSSNFLDISTIQTLANDSHPVSYRP